MDKLNKILNLFNLEINKEFEIVSEKQKKYRVYYDGKILVKTAEPDSWQESHYTLQDIILEKVTIKKEPWIPKSGGVYYYAILERVDTGEFKPHSVEETFWYNGTYDLERFLVGNCFETRTEAYAGIEKLAKMYSERINSCTPFFTCEV